MYLILRTQRHYKKNLHHPGTLTTETLLWLTETTTEYHSTYATTTNTTTDITTPQIHSFIHYKCLYSFIHSGYIYSTSSSPLLLRGAPDTAQIQCWSFTPKRHRQM